MLVLTRRVGDSIVIGDEIVVTVLEVRSDQVRIGIDAPREVPVHREEVYRQMTAGEPGASEAAERAEALRRRLRRPGRRSNGGRGAPPANGTGTAGNDTGAPPGDEPAPP